MKLNDYFLPAVLAGFAVGVLTSVPVIKMCCFISAIGGFFAVYLFKSASKTDVIQFRHSAFIGVLTGLFAGIFTTLFEVIFTYVTKTNDFVESLYETEKVMKENFGQLFESTFQLLKYMSREITTTGFSPLFTIFMLFSNSLIDIIFAFIGAVIARGYFNRKVENL